MSPAQRRNRLNRFKTRKTGFRFIKYLFLVILIGALALVVALQTKYWGTRNKLSTVISAASGDVVISTFDPEGESITNVLIPANTQLDVARGLGSFRAKSIWQLGINEKLGGKLLTETIVKNFHFPVYTWGDNNIKGLADVEFLSIFRAVFFPAKTNLKIGDRIKMAFFSLGVKASKRVNIDLREGQYLKKTRLVDGEEGYLVSGVGLSKLFPTFSENGISQQNLRVNVKDATGQRGVAEQIGATLEVLGVKVASLERKRVEDLDCSFRTKNEDLAKKVSFIFSCKREKIAPEGNFDLELNLGSQFAKRY